jgi:hypothetical protein
VTEEPQPPGTDGFLSWRGQGQGQLLSQQEIWHLVRMGAGCGSGPVSATTRKIRVEPVSKPQKLTAS